MAIADGAGTSSGGLLSDMAHYSKAGHFFLEKIQSAMRLTNGTMASNDHHGFRPVRLAIRKHGIVRRTAIIIEGKNCNASSMMRSMMLVFKYSLQVELC